MKIEAHEGTGPAFQPQQPATSDLETQVSSPALPGADALDVAPRTPTVPAPARASARRSGAAVLSRLPNISIDDRLGRVLLSGVLALLLWFYVLNLENPPQTTSFNQLQLDIRGVRDDLKLINTMPNVELTIQAPENIMSTLRQSDIQPFIDLTGLDAGVHDVPIRSEITHDAGASLINVVASPRQVQVQLEVQVTRVFTVSVVTSGTPAFGYGQEPAQVMPGEVEVTGSANALERVAAVQVSVDLDQKAGTQQGSKTPIAVDNTGAEIRGLTFEPATVQVVVPLKLLINAKAVPVRVPVLGQPASGYRVSNIRLEPTNVNICCAPNLLETVDFLETLPVSITGTTTSVVTTTQLVLPAGVELYGQQDNTVNVTINVEALVTTFQVAVAPTIDGLSPPLTALVSPDQLEVTLSGSFDQVQNVTPLDLRAFVNVTGRAPGTYEITPRVVVPQGFQLVRTNPEVVTVTILAPTPLPATSTPTLTPSPTPPDDATESPTVAATPLASETAPTLASSPGPSGTPAPALPQATGTPGAGATPVPQLSPSPAP